MRGRLLLPLLFLACETSTAARPMAPSERSRAEHAREDGRIEASLRRATAERARVAAQDQVASTRARDQTEERGARAEQDRAREHAEWCASDRAERIAARAEQLRAEEQRLIAEAAAEAAAEKRAEYLRTKCKRRDHAVYGRTGEVCIDENGYFLACEGIVGVEVRFDCPADGPVGLRGAVRGIVRSGDDSTRVVTLSKDRLAAIARQKKDKDCRDADEASAAR